MNYETLVEIARFGIPIGIICFLLFEGLNQTGKNRWVFLVLCACFSFWYTSHYFNLNDALMQCETSSTLSATF